MQREIQLLVIFIYGSPCTKQNRNKQIHSLTLLFSIFLIFFFKRNRIGVPVADPRVQGRTQQKTVVEAAHVVKHTI